MLDIRWSLVHTASCHWVAQMTNLVLQQNFVLVIHLRTNIEFQKKIEINLVS